MLWTAIGDVLPLTIALTLSPLALITGIVLLLGPGGQVRSALFGLGWFAYLFAVAAVAFWMVDVAEDASAESAADGVDVVQLLLGVLFLALTVVSWRKRPRPGEPVKENAILARLAGITPLGALGLGLAQGIGVVKNTPLALGAGARLGESGLSGRQGLVALLVFAVVSTGGILVPLLVSVVGGQRVTDRLTDARGWLEANMSPITITVLLIVGFYFLGQGLGILG